MRGVAAVRVWHRVLCCKDQKSAWAGLLLSMCALQVGVCCNAGGLSGWLLLTEKSRGGWVSILN